MRLYDRILAALEASEHPLSSPQLAEIVYASDPDGGPEYAATSISVTIFQQRDRGDDRIETLKRGYGVRGRTYDPSPVDQRTATICRLRQQGLTYPVIGQRLGVTATYACMLYKAAERRSAA